MGCPLERNLLTASSGEMLKASKLEVDEEGPGDDEEEELRASGTGEEASGVDWIEGKGIGERGDGEIERD